MIWKGVVLNHLQKCCQKNYAAREIASVIILLKVAESKDIIQTGLI
jgi:hypothetical protein